jgi:hypothetical protein
MSDEEKFICPSCESGLTDLDDQVWVPYYYEPDHLILALDGDHEGIYCSSCIEYYESYGETFAIYPPNCRVIKFYLSDRFLHLPGLPGHAGYDEADLDYDEEELILSYIETVRTFGQRKIWKKVDGWRGYDTVNIPDGWERVVNGSFGIGGETFGDSLVRKLEKKLRSAAILPFEGILYLPLTSNCCVVGVEFFVRKGSEEQFINWIKEE